MSYCHPTQLSVVVKDERRLVKGIKSGEINWGWGVWGGVGGRGYIVSKGIYVLS